MASSAAFSEKNMPLFQLRLLFPKYSNFPHYTPQLLILICRMSYLFWLKVLFVKSCTHNTLYMPLLSLVISQYTYLIEYLAHLLFKVIVLDASDIHPVPDM